MHCGHRWVHAHLLSVVVQGCEQEGGLRRDSTHTLDQLLCHLSVCPHLHRQHQHGLVGCGRCLCRLLGQRRGLQHLGRLVGFEVGLHRLVEPRQPRAHRVLVHQRHHRTVHGQLQALVGLGQSGTAGQCLRHVDALQQIQSQRASLAGSLPGQHLADHQSDLLRCRDQSTMGATAPDLGREPHHERAFNDDTRHVLLDHHLCARVGGLVDCSESGHSQLA
mmetsp:Transcript_34965/g.77645  ORF Transcript_34965/g.77645 Transcript_34965/m.77645 type:complete len:220 (-) Transcript_34965:1308-1967(-)